MEYLLRFARCNLAFVILSQIPWQNIVYAPLEDCTFYECIKWLLKIYNILYILPENAKGFHLSWKLYGELEAINIFSCSSGTYII